MAVWTNTALKCNFEGLVWMWIKIFQVINAVFTLFYQVGKETVNTEMRGQKPSSLDGDGTAVEEVCSKKAETGSGYLLKKHAGIHQEKHPAAAERYIWFFLHLDPNI